MGCHYILKLLHTLVRVWMSPFVNVSVCLPIYHAVCAGVTMLQCLTWATILTPWCVYATSVLSYIKVTQARGTNSPTSDICQKSLLLRKNDNWCQWSKSFSSAMVVSMLTGSWWQFACQSCTSSFFSLHPPLFCHLFAPRRRGSCCFLSPLPPSQAVFETGRL